MLFHPSAFSRCSAKVCWTNRSSLLTAVIMTSWERQLPSGFENQLSSAVIHLDFVVPSEPFEDGVEYEWVPFAAIQNLIL